MIIVFYELGNKCDMEGLREVDFAEAKAMQEQCPEILTILEVSAKENTCVEDCFLSLARELKVSSHLSHRETNFSLFIFRIKLTEATLKPIPTWSLLWENRAQSPNAAFAAK
jgi:hypothetical protein